MFRPYGTMGGYFLVRTYFEDKNQRFLSSKYVRTDRLKKNKF
jgi:hypothetical protein